MSCLLISDDASVGQPLDDPGQSCIERRELRPRLHGRVDAIEFAEPRVTGRITSVRIKCQPRGDEPVNTAPDFSRQPTPVGTQPAGRDQLVLHSLGKLGLPRLSTETIVGSLEREQLVQDDRCRELIAAKISDSGRSVQLRGSVGFADPVAFVAGNRSFHCPRAAKVDHHQPARDCLPGSNWPA